MGAMILIPLIVLLLCAALAGVILYGKLRWRAFTSDLNDQLEAARLPLTLSRFDPHGLESLPPPVRCYFRTVLTEGELMRFFAEAPWYPTALLPSQGVEWSGVDDHSALATLQDGDLETTLLFGFNPEGTIQSVRAEARGRITCDTVEFAPWEGRFWNYAQREGMKIPMEAEVAWILPSGAKPYCRLKLTKLTYDFEP